MNIKEYTVEILLDPTGILVGERYEFYLEIDVDEDDELYYEGGVLLRVIFAVHGTDSKIVHYNFVEKETNQVLDFALEEDEEQVVLEFCKTHYE